MSDDPVTAKALRIIEDELEAIAFDLDRLNRNTAVNMEQMLTLRERRRNLERLYRMHGGTPAEYAPEAIPA